MFLTDAVFNGLDLIVLVAVACLAWVARASVRRHERNRARLRQSTSPADGFDRAMDDLFGEDAFAWPSK